MPFRYPLPRDLQLLVLEFNSPPPYDKGMVSYLEWMWGLLMEDYAAFDTVAVEFCLEPVYSPDARYTPAPWSMEPQFGSWEVFINVRMESVVIEGKLVPRAKYKLHWENWGEAGFSHDVEFRRMGDDFQALDLLKYAPRDITKMPRCRICPNLIKFDGVSENISDYWDFHVSELMAGPVRFRNAHLKP